jgi:hypothetical protein
MQLSEACRLYNAALQERRDAYRTHRKSLNYDQASQPPGRIVKGYTHDKCELSCQYANLESHQGSARSSLSSVYGPCSLGCLAFAGRDDWKGP